MDRADCFLLPVCLNRAFICTYSSLWQQGDYYKLCACISPCSRQACNLFKSTYKISCGAWRQSGGLVNCTKRSSFNKSTIDLTNITTICYSSGEQQGALLPRQTFTRGATRNENDIFRGVNIVVQRPSVPRVFFLNFIWDPSLVSYKFSSCKKNSSKNTTV